MRVFNSVLAAFTIATTLVATALLAMLVALHGGSAADAALVKSASGSVYQIVFHLKRVNSEEAIDKVFWDISTPGSERYRKFLSHAELQELVGAPRSVVAKARHFLETEAGCVRVEQLSTNDGLVCTLSTKSARSLKTALAVEQAFAAVEEQDKDKGVAAPGSAFRIDVTARMPLAVRKLIRAAVAYRKVSKALKPKSGRELFQEKNVGQPGMTQTPSTINRRYKVPASARFPALARNVSGAVGEFEGEYFLSSDITTYASTYNLNAYRVEVMGGNSNNGDADAVEGTLDIVALGSIFNATIPILWAEGGSNNNDPGNIDFTTWIDKLLARREPPAVVSISWGYGVYRAALDPQVLALDNDAFRKAGALGITLLAASGDSGVGTRSQILQCTVFNPSWPASSPYVTSVGALYANSESESEIALSWTGSGFSNNFARPPYQDAAVSAYLQNTQGLPAASYFNASGRAYPDVTALGSNYNIFVNGQWQLVSGTSAASPTFAGILTLIVAERVAAGKPRFGFLNPTIYQLGRVGQDITQGQNQDDNCIPFIPIQGFPAAPGWDAVTGFGSPDYEFLRANL